MRPPGPLFASAQARQWLANVVADHVADPTSVVPVKAEDIRRPSAYRHMEGTLVTMYGGYPYRLPYTNRVIESPTSHPVDVDHLISLDDAIHSGGWKWTEDQWKQFQGDPGVLVLSDPTINRVKKRAKDIAEWTPPEHKQWFACDYAMVKLAYGLTFTSAQAARIEELLTSR